MKEKIRLAADAALMILPYIAGMTLKVLTEPASEGIEITGARVYCTLNMPLQPLPITETQVNMLLVTVALFGLCRFLTCGMTARGAGKRQLLAEWLVEKTDTLVRENMGARFAGFSPFVGAILALSACCSLLTLAGLFPPTSDLNVTAGWAILVAVLITYYKCQAGPLHYLKSFTEPVAFLTPLNIVSEVATPVSMAFRHYGNILSGTVISTLLAAGLQGASAKLLGWLPGALGRIPFLQIGIPAVLSVYFDVFSGCLQAFIFAMLTMLYISSGFPEEAVRNRKKTAEV